MSKHTPPPERSQLKNLALFLEEEGANGSPTTLPLNKIHLPASQPRRYFDPLALQSLTESIRREGVLQPVLVRPHNTQYELVAGERRYRASQAAGLSEIPVTIRQISDEEAILYSLIENLHREDLNPIEETEGILDLLANHLKLEKPTVLSLLYHLDNEVKGKIQPGRTNELIYTQSVLGKPPLELVQEVFDALGRMTWQSFITTRLPLLKLPEDILDALRFGQLEYTKAKQIAKIPDPIIRQTLLLDTIQQKLSLREVRDRVQEHIPTPKSPGLLGRFEKTTQKLRKLKKLWKNPQKRKQLEQLLHQMEALINSEN